MARIYLSPAQHANPGACIVNGQRYREDVYCRKIANRAAKKLRAAGHTVRVSTNWPWDNFVGAASESNAWNADLHVPIHSNATGSASVVLRGTDTFYASSEGQKLALRLLNHVSRVSGVRRSCTRKTWHELTATRAVAGYIEVDFHDNAAGCRHITTHVREFGDAVAAGVLDYVGTPRQSKSKIPAAARAVRSAFLALPDKWQLWVCKYVDRWRVKGG